MKIAVTADVHLRTRDETPHRFAALENIFQQCVDQKIKHIIIAGDLFDLDLHEFGDFENLCNETPFRELNIHVIPGNHDSNISNSRIASDNVNIYSEPAWVKFGKTWDGLFIPYTQGRLMGDLIQGNPPDKKANNWFIISHGDYLEGTRDPDPYEQGVYMPLTRKDAEICDARFIFLGHIHKPHEHNKVYYGGSPCGLDITETGQRRFLVLDTNNKKVIRNKVATNVIYFDEQFVVFPTKKEKDLLLEQIEERVKDWKLEKIEFEKVQLRVKVRGYSHNRENLNPIIKEGFKGFSFYNEPDVTDVKYSNDPDREYLVAEFMSNLDKVDWQPQESDPNKEQIILGALKIIYGEK